MERFIGDLLEFTRFDFRLIKKLQTSGQRIAYLGDHDGSRVVLKITPSHATVVARVQREFSVLSSLDSSFFPKILRATFVTRENLNDYYDKIIGEDHGAAITFSELNLSPFLYTVEEYIDNVEWPAVLPRLRSMEAFIDFFSNLVIAVSKLWEKRIIHRDLKPDNILIRTDLSPVVIDLGIAKSLNVGTRDITGTFFHTPCTPRFAAPEQLLNKKNEISYKSDQFSIGVIAYLILTNKFPYGDIERDGLDFVIRAMHSGKVPDLSEAHIVNDDIFGFVLRLLEVQPYKRFRKVDEILGALGDIRRKL